ncbi:TetR/AcrR family transcriptional regulator [Peptostreptococcus equinus]|uniref:TetR/AcrR family transcriptional regulator n=1 Tax=Peptostreptococcus equinus TaxID=3003601 RepID=A0ABY7JQP8_9FIRM|nr:TetR/AcrR family transcriptional regulator [Peptostreptococcus sp. CBA3647]WAW14373.1 TetR/AcrR family transcriptional regulator [Peptostreptococcus sp. CBA3647]
MCAAKRLTETERKKKIMNSASKVIIEKGLEKTTMEDIIAGTTLSKGGVYHYYKSVIEIFKDIMLYGIEYRNEIIKEHLYESKEIVTNEFMAKQRF